MNRHDKCIQELYEEFKNNENFFCDHVFVKHWQVGCYIRNKYIWISKEVVKYWCDYYNVPDADEASMCIIDEVRQLITLEKNRNHQ